MRLDEQLKELCALIQSNVLQSIFTSGKSQRDIITNQAARLQTQLEDGDVLIGNIEGVPLTARHALELLSHDASLLDSMVFVKENPIQRLVSIGEVRQAVAHTIKMTGVAMNRLPQQRNHRSVFHVCSPLVGKHRPSDRSLFLSITITVECPTEKRTVWTQTLRFFEHDSKVLGDDAYEVYESDQFTRSDTAKKDGFKLIGHAVTSYTWFDTVSKNFSTIVETCLDSLLADAKRTAEQTSM